MSHNVHVILAQGEMELLGNNRSNVTRSLARASGCWGPGRGVQRTGRGREGWRCWSGRVWWDSGMSPEPRASPGLLLVQDPRVQD